jgi:hypothetical protein
MNFSKTLLTQNSAIMKKIAGFISISLIVSELFYFPGFKVLEYFICFLVLSCKNIFHVIFISGFLLDPPFICSILDSRHFTRSPLLEMVCWSRDTVSVGENI